MLYWYVTSHILNFLKYMSFYVIHKTSSYHIHNNIV